MKYWLLGKGYKLLLKPLLFLSDPETVHDRFTVLGRKLGNNKTLKQIVHDFLHYQHPSLHQDLAGIKFANPVGLSAGFDKDANLQNILPDVGFGFMQVGSVTLNPYVGNPKPRLYRLKKSKGLVVYYGLKNIGADAVIQKLKSDKGCFPISVSIAKTNASYTKDTEAGIKDYVACLQKFSEAAVGDFYTLNISCPNTFGGEPFSTTERLEKLLKSVDKLSVSKPIFVKMPINLPWADFKKLLNTMLQFNIAGVVIGNLTKVRDPELIHDPIPVNITGGISGLPTQQLSNDLISQTFQYCGDRLKIIGVGGIFSAEDAYEKIKRGASLVQLITGMIYEGPQIVGEINQKMVQFLKRDGYQNISQAVGAYYVNKKA